MFLFTSLYKPAITLYVEIILGSELTLENGGNKIFFVKYNKNFALIQ